ncbi:hypothetical protein BaRGS_00024891 [Batillaria attramentaria]|uniref:AAA+ ATPase domain-containing protein n=1 Tax=Batillaria attramentaria TaxID=370345 RepID=A0ABD0K9X8_9CAEN
MGRGKKRRCPSSWDGAKQKRVCDSKTLHEWSRPIFQGGGHHFIPYVYINKVHYKQEQVVPGLTVEMRQPLVTDQKPGEQPATQESRIRDDRSNIRALRCLKKFADRHPQCMVVIAQLRFEDCMVLCDDDNLPCPRKFPDPAMRRGDFDILILHREYGLLVLEIKSVGDKFDSSSKENQKDDEVLKKLQKAVDQLNKQQTMLRFMVSDKQPLVRVLASLVFPNVTREQLERILQNNPTDKNKLCQCLGIPDSADPIDLCLHADNLTNKETSQQNNVSHWWIQRVASNNQDSSMTEERYLDLIARFCGPATRAPPQFRTPEREVFSYAMGEAVAEIGDIFGRFVFYEYQIDLVKKMPRLVYLTGPPGTGKTTTLLLAALVWLTRGWDVHIVSTCLASLAASHLIAHQIVQAMKGVEKRVHMHELDLNNLDAEEVKLFDQLLQTACADRPFCVIADEAHCSRDFSKFCEKLCKKTGSLFIWAAHIYHGYRPACLQEVRFLECLRTPPVVTRKVQKSCFFSQGIVFGYAPDTTPTETDGPPVLKVNHSSPRHTQGLPKDCQTTGSSTLRYRDVFVLTNHYELEGSVDPQNEDKVGNEEGDHYRSACGFVQGLIKEGIPVRVVEKGKSAALKEVASQTGPDEAVAADANTIRGLERKVVVSVQTDKEDEDDFKRLDSLSRSTSQIILVA